MQRLLYVLFQLDEARRYIEDGRLERLRLALLLLDNAAEIQMDRQIQTDLIHEEMRERLHKQVLQIAATERPANLNELAQWEPLTHSEKARIERFFDEKVKHLSERWSRLDSRLAEPLKYLHRYRRGVPQGKGSQRNDSHSGLDTVRDQLPAFSIVIMRWWFLRFE